MTPEDPYASPEASIADVVGSSHPISWPRIVVWGALVCGVNAAIYLVSGYIYSKHAIYGIKVDDILATTASFFLYIIFLHTLASRHFLQLGAVFLFASLFSLLFGAAINFALHLLLDQPMSNLISWPEQARYLIICLLAYAVWYSTARKGP